MRRLLTILAGSLLALAAAEAREPTHLDVPVMVGGNADLDACPTEGRIVGLDPKGDNFLSVRTGPGGKPYHEIDRLHTDDRVFICGSKGPWLAVVYGESPDGACGVGTPWPVRKAYSGPCNFGWIHSRYVQR